MRNIAILILSASAASAAAAEQAVPASLLGSFRARPVGPALTCGRVLDFAVHPDDASHYFVATAGGVWKTTNAGTTWRPVFDRQGSYSIGCVVLDPTDPNTVWVGTGENNAQRSISYGDGVYKSTDGGRSWKNVGLKDSLHVGKIWIDPRDGDRVFVAAQGPLWSAGGERGLYYTEDGGDTWTKVLNISENTGVNDIVAHPDNPDVMLASSYQRRRRVWTLVNGGPESAIYKSADGGKTWRKVTSGLPRVELGRIGLAFAPSDSSVCYALVEAAKGQGGTFRSTNHGQTWAKVNSFDTQGQYYGEVFVDPEDADRIYIPNTFTQVSDDGGRTLRSLGESNKHVDTHAFWVDPEDNDHYRSGCDGGIYESFDGGKNWRYINNLPITQFYDIAAGNDGPFYHVYGGTQDNFTLGGPAKTPSRNGVTNYDWFVCKGGDGFQCKVDPTDPNIIYCESQYGVLARFNKRTGESTTIQPQPDASGEPLRWNWDSPLVLSPHDPKRLYFAANVVFRSDDRGNTWKRISGDLTRQLDRDKLKVFDRVLTIDAVAKHLSTSVYGNIVALSESPLRAGLLYAGTDDGLIRVTEDGGEAWRKVKKFPGLRGLPYVARVLASRHNRDCVYAAFDNHKNGDFKPYLLKSEDAGKTWKSVAGDLPDRGTVLAIAEDPKNADMLFAGTEYGLFVTLDGGRHWLPMRSGLPTIAVRDLVVQEQENDLVVGTFGRGIYVIDDYSPMRDLSPEVINKESHLFPIKKALMYTRKAELGGGGKAYQGANFFVTPNPAYGATITYHLKKSIRTLKQKRAAAESKAVRAGKAPPIPTNGELRAEAAEEAPTLLLTITDADDKVVRVLTGPAGRGLHRVTWDLTDRPAGVPVVPGVYGVTMSRRVNGKIEPLPGQQTVTVEEYTYGEKVEHDHAARYEFQVKASRLNSAARAASREARSLADRLAAIKRAADATPGLDPKWATQARELVRELATLRLALDGDRVAGRYNRQSKATITGRAGYAYGSSYRSLDAPTQTQREAYRLAGAGLDKVVGRLRAIINDRVPPLEEALESAGAAYTPGRLPSVPK